MIIILCKHRFAFEGSHIILSHDSEYNDVIEIVRENELGKSARPKFQIEICISLETCLTIYPNNNATL